MGSHRDVFPDVPALKSQLKDKRDYRIRARDRGAFATIVSPHGGYIEEGVHRGSQLALALDLISTSSTSRDFAQKNLRNCTSLQPDFVNQR